MMRSYFRLLQATHIRSTDRDRWCGNTKVSYNGCHNRHCTTCFGHDRAEWVERILSWSLPIDYLHAVFTLPHEFIPLILANEGELYRCLFQAVSRTLKGLPRNVMGSRWAM